MAKARWPCHGHHRVADPTFGRPLAEPHRVSGLSSATWAECEARAARRALRQSHRPPRGLERRQIGPNLKRKRLIAGSEQPIAVTQACDRKVSALRPPLRRAEIASAPRSDGRHCGASAAKRAGTSTAKSRAELRMAVRRRFQSDAQSEPARPSFARLTASLIIAGETVVAGSPN